MSKQDDVMKECRDLLASGAAVEQIISILRERGFSKAHSIKVLVDLGQADMNEAKGIVHKSPTWADVRERDEEFQRDFI